MQAGWISIYYIVFITHLVHSTYIGVDSRNRFESFVRYVCDVTRRILHTVTSLLTLSMLIACYEI